MTDPMLRSFNQSQDNVIAITMQWLRLLQVKVTYGTLSRALREHPDYPSLLSIADNLHQWKVASKGLKLVPEQLTQLPLPLTAHFSNNQLVLVTGITGKTITFVNDRNKEVNTSLDNFAGQWDGVVLLAEANDLSGEPRYAGKHRLELLQQLKIPALLLLMILLIMLNGARTAHLLPALFSGVMLAGIIVTCLLLWYEVDRRNPVLHKICTAGKNTNCGAILQSGAAKLWGLISWSEIGFAYFTGGFLSLLLSGFNPAVTEVVAWLNLLATPYILFSLFYQWRLARQWCVLCLGVQALLLAGFLVNLPGGVYTHLPQALPTGEVTVLLLSFSLPLLIWTAVKPVLIKAREGRHHKTALQRLKHDRRIFEALLTRQKMITENPEGLGITLGNSQAKTKLIKVCNPYCGPCARAHPEIEKIIENSLDVSAQIIFTATDDEKDRRSEPVKHLMAIDEKGNKNLTKQALDDWYNPPTLKLRRTSAPKKDSAYAKSSEDRYAVFANKYPLNGELQQQGKKLKAMSEWCEKTEISFTPTFFVQLPSPDGEELRVRQLPDIYSVEDLKYLLA